MKFYRSQFRYQNDAEVWQWIEQNQDDPAACQLALAYISSRYQKRFNDLIVLYTLIGTIIAFVALLVAGFQPPLTTFDRIFYKIELLGVICYLTSIVFVYQKRKKSLDL